MIKEAAVISHQVSFILLLSLLLVLESLCLLINVLRKLAGLSSLPRSPIFLLLQLNL
jgi:hypothetical protein